MESLILKTPPPLDPAWLEEEQRRPQKVYAPILEKQPAYAAECRDLHAKMMAPGAQYAHLRSGLIIQHFAIPSTTDRHWIPMMQYFREVDGAAVPGHDVVAVYYHGGGLYVGEADSEDLSCRQLMHAPGVGSITLYSVGYRLMPQHAASTSVADAVDAYNWIAARSGPAKIIVMGSSSGGQLAALVAQAAVAPSPQVGGGRSASRLAGVLLRCPVTSDVSSGKETYVPARLRAAHTSADPAFATSLLGVMRRTVPRDGLPRMPLEAEAEVLARLPRTWIQVCTNDVLYSDGVCYAMALEEAGVPVQLDVVSGWPHTFWLLAPWLDRAWEADEEMLRGFRWLVEADGEKTE